MSRSVIVLLALTAAGCAPQEPSLDQELQELRRAAEAQRGQVPPLPLVREYTPARYTASAVADPFYPRAERR
jgi:Tfp pilus assembly protein PilP